MFSMCGSKNITQWQVEPLEPCVLCGVESLLKAQQSWALGERGYHRAVIAQMCGHY